MEGQKHTLSVLIVDDHPIMRFGVSSIINSQPDMQVVAQAGTENESVAAYARHKPDVVLMDLRLADGSGLEAIRRIIQRDPRARVVVLTTYEGDEDIHQALAAGARGYLIKGLSHQELLRALKLVAAGQRFLPAVVSNVLSSRLPSTILTPREQDVLRGVFRGRNNREIADELQIGEATVKTHVSVILMKLNVTDRTSAVVEALKRGLLHL